MPTASQAMILMEVGSDHHVPRRHCSSMSHLKPKSQQHKSKPLPKAVESFPTFEKGKPGPRTCPGTTPQQIVLQGYRGNMFFDQETRRFKWQVISQCTNVSEEILKTTSIDCEHREGSTPSVQSQIYSKPTKLLPRRERMTEVSAHSETRQLPGKYGVDDKSYSRLEELGFRRRFIPAPSKVSQRSGAKYPELHHDIPKPRGSVTRSSTYDSPYRESPNRTFTVSESPQTYAGGEHEVSENTLSLIDEIKHRVGYENRIFPAMYMRKSYPEEQPLSLCFSLRDDNISHYNVKRWIEAKTGLNVAGIQYDPVSIRAGASTGSRWIVTMTTLEDCRKLLQMGLEVDGEKVMVKWLDDVMVCEFDAYKIHCQEEQRIKMNKINNTKSEKNFIKSI